VTLQEYLASSDFGAFIDEVLRNEAIQAVDFILSTGRSIKRHQLHAIPAVIQGAGLDGLRDLAKKQKEKNTKGENKAFWGHIDALLSQTPTSGPSLFGFLLSTLGERGLIASEEAAGDAMMKRQVRKRNREIIDGVMGRVIGVYFEHFNCHYFYRAIAGGKR
jgi:hypothetical protein